MEVRESPLPSTARNKSYMHVYTYVCKHKEPKGGWKRPPAVRIRGSTCKEKKSKGAVLRVEFQELSFSLSLISMWWNFWRSREGRRAWNVMLEWSEFHIDKFFSVAAFWRNLWLLFEYSRRICVHFIVGNSDWLYHVKVECKQAEASDERVWVWASDV